MAAKQVICDTDVIIDYLDRKQIRHVETKEILEDNIGIDNVVLSGITQIELMLGAVNKQDLLKIKKSIFRFIIIMINEDINIKASSLIERYALSHGIARQPYCSYCNCSRPRIIYLQYKGLYIY